MLSNVRHYQCKRWEDVVLCAGLQAQGRGTLLLKVLLSLWEQLKKCHGTIPPPRHCIYLHFSYISYACCLRQAAFSSRTDALPTTWHGLCFCWELFMPLKPSTKVLLNNGILPPSRWLCRQVRKAFGLGWFPGRQVSSQGKCSGDEQAESLSWKSRVSPAAANCSKRR